MKKHLPKLNKDKKKLTGAIMQPSYLSWLGYYDLIDRANVFVFYDDAQLVKRSWCTRNRIKTSNGIQTLTVPVKKTAHRDEITYKDAEINYEQDWVNEHLKAIKLNYARSSHFEPVCNLLEAEYQKCPKYLADLNIGIIRTLSLLLGIETKFIRSSKLQVEGKKDKRLVQICQAVGVGAYLSPQGSADYIEQENPGGEFGKTGIELFYQNFEHPKYPQLWGEFISHLSVIDALMNCGPAETIKLIRGGQKKNYNSDEFREIIKKDH